MYVIYRQRNHICIYMGVASQFQENNASYDIHFRYTTMWHVNVHFSKVWAIWIFDPFFEKNTKVIVHGLVKIWHFCIGNGIKPFYVRMYVYMTRNYMANTRVTACLFISFSYGLYVQFWVNIYMGVVSTSPQFSGNLSKLWHSFSLYNYVTYRRTF